MFGRIFARTATRRLSPAPKARLSLEALEPREVPAGSYTWRPMSGTDATNGMNWLPWRSPVANDSLFFDPAVSTASCDNLPGSTYGTFELRSGYTGTVTMTGPASIGTLGITSGALATPNGSSDISVRAGFNWTGGDLNPTSTHNTLHLLGGALVTVAPTDGGSVTTGDTFSFENLGPTIGETGGSHGTFSPGTVNFLNGADVIVTAFCKVGIETTAAKAVLFQNAQPAQVSQEEVTDGTLEVPGDGVFNSEGRAVKISGGTYRLKAPVTANITGRVGGGATAGSVEMTSGILAIQHGATLKAEHGVKMTGGQLQTLERDRTLRQQPHAFIVGDVTVTGGDVVIMATSPSRLRDGFPSDSPVFFGSLWVEGEVTWTGGTYHPCVREAAGGALNSDGWHAEKKFTISGGSPKIQPGSLTEAGVRGVAPPVGRSYVIISSDEMITIALFTLTIDPPWAYEFEESRPAKALIIQRERWAG